MTMHATNERTEATGIGVAPVADPAPLISLTHANRLLNFEKNRWQNMARAIDPFGNGMACNLIVLIFAQWGNVLLT